MTLSRSSACLSSYQVIASALVRVPVKKLGPSLLHGVVRGGLRVLVMSPDSIFVMLTCSIGLTITVILGKSNSSSLIPFVGLAFLRHTGSHGLLISSLRMLSDACGNVSSPNISFASNLELGPSLCCCVSYKSLFLGLVAFG